MLIKIWRKSDQIEEKYVKFGKNYVITQLLLEIMLNKIMKIWGKLCKNGEKLWHIVEENNVKLEENEVHLKKIT